MLIHNNNYIRNSTTITCWYMPIFQSKRLITVVVKNSLVALRIFLGSGKLFNWFCSLHLMLSSAKEASRKSDHGQ